MLTREGVLIGRVLWQWQYQYPPWAPYAAAGATIVLMTLFAMILPSGSGPASLPHLNVAFIGNSMQYYNDLPRLLETLANGKMTQNSCLHGGASLSTILVWGNGMGSKWKTGTARIGSDTNGNAIYDFGACTVPQLLFGYDAALNERDATFHNKDENGQEINDDGNMKNIYSEDADDFFSYFDGSNPCLLNENYLPYLQDVYYYTNDTDTAYDSGHTSTTTFDFVVMNDNTRSPARNDTREEGLQVLASTYVPWFLEMSNAHTIPVFIRYVDHDIKMMIIIIIMQHSLNLFYFLALFFFL